VVADVRSPRDGKYVENIGLYNPCTTPDKEFAFDNERFMHWVNLGAEVSENVMNLLARANPNVHKSLINMEVERKQKALAKRKERKKAAKQA
jgi:small subunit ribosomal protein S16